jgi:hypothetical protein
MTEILVLIGLLGVALMLVGIALVEAAEWRRRQRFRRDIARARDLARHRGNDVAA